MDIIAIGADHAGYTLKGFLTRSLISSGYQIVDFGTSSEESVDYPDIIHPLARAIDQGEFRVGIIICGTGVGASMVANKYRNVRAALCWIPQIAILARQHNDANILAMPGRFIDHETAWEITRSFLTTSFEGGRHERRIGKITPQL